MAFDYIKNDYGRTWVASRFASRKGVHIPMSFIDINDGNMYDAVLFAQIMYWHEPSTETGKPRLTRQHAGELWLAKQHGEWWDECRINKATVRKCLERIKRRGLIFYELHGEKGKKSPFIRVNWDTFERLMKAWEAALDTDGVCPDRTGGMLQQDRGMSYEVKPNTENTSEITQRGEEAPPTPQREMQSDAPTEPAAKDPERDGPPRWTFNEEYAAGQGLLNPDPILPTNPDKTAFTLKHPLYAGWRRAYRDKGLDEPTTRDRKGELWLALSDPDFIAKNYTEDDAYRMTLEKLKNRGNYAFRFVLEDLAEWRNDNTFNAVKAAEAHVNSAPYHRKVLGRDEFGELIYETPEGALP